MPRDPDDQQQQDDLNPPSTVDVQALLHFT